MVYGLRGNPQSFRDTTGAIYLELADMLLRQADEAATEVQQRELLHEARAVMEDFKTIELQDYFRDECVTAQQQKVKPQAVDNLMTHGTATLYPILFPERLVLLLSLANGEIRQTIVPISATDIRQTATDFRKELARSGNPRKLRQQGLKLYQWLIAPIDRELKAHAIDTLVVVPDDVLRTIPFAALHEGQDYLVSRYALAITPGLTLTNPGIFTREHPRVLLNGLSKAVQDFDPLPYVPEEIGRTASFYDDSTQQLLDDAFQKRSVQTRLDTTWKVRGF